MIVAHARMTSKVSLINDITIAFNDLDISIVWLAEPCRTDTSWYQAVMLASLRSLVPKEWDSDHEVAWNWLWEIFSCNRVQEETLAVSACTISIYIVYIYIYTFIFIFIFNCFYKLSLNLFYAWLPLPRARSKGVSWHSFLFASLCSCSHDSHVCGSDLQNKKLSVAVLSPERQPSHPRLILVFPWFWSCPPLLSPSESPSVPALSWPPAHHNQLHHHWSSSGFQCTPAAAPLSSNVLLT